MNPIDLDLRLYRFLADLRFRLRPSREARAALHFSLRATREFFGAHDACIATLRPGREFVELVAAIPRGDGWNLDLLTAFRLGLKPSVPFNIILAPLSRRERPWGVLGLRQTDGEFAKDEKRALVRIAAQISESLHETDRERILEVRSSIDRKIMQRLRPKDLFYQILHSLRTLTGYDHSSALLIYEEGGESLRLVAEQIAWSKGKSRRIGQTFPLGADLRRLVGEEEVYGLDRDGAGWREWGGRKADSLAALLDSSRARASTDSSDGENASSAFHGERDARDAAHGDTGAAARTHRDDPAHGDPGVDPAPPEAAMLLAPLGTRDGLLGVLKVAALHEGSFGPYEAELVRRFMPVASVAIQNSQRTASLEVKMLEAERKHAVADLARGVSHDVNNALGSILPLVQQIQADLEAGRIDSDVFREDLRNIESSVQVCRRIFGGMLSLARESARKTGQGDVRRAIDSSLAVLEDGMKRRKIWIELDLPDHLPMIKGGQGDLEQLFLNLATNARDAMPSGGALRIGARRVADTVEITVTDTGCGIPAESMSRIQEPFFSTKPHGSGLGLSICRSIVWEIGGEIRFESAPGAGTKVTILAPVIDERRGEAPA